MEFTEIDMKTWPRAQEFRFFTQMMPNEFSITTELDVTALLRRLKEKGIKFYPAFLWLVTRELIKQPEFRTTIKDNKLGYYDTLCPLFPVFHDDTKTFSSLWLDYTDDFAAFYRDYEDVVAKFGDSKRFLARRDKFMPENTYVISSIPWLNFSHFSVHNLGNKPYFLPTVDSGKYVEKNGRLMMPVSLTCHHAVADGYHFSVFFDGLQKSFDSFEL